MACKKERLFEIHISRNVKIEIFAMKITDEQVNDVKELPKLVGDIKNQIKKQRSANCLLMVPMMAMMFLGVCRTIES